MSNSTWYQSDIYQALVQRNGRSTEHVRNLLNRPTVMPTIEAVLDLGGTTPKDFTLHNSDHSFRVAQKMWQLIPDTTKAILSDYEMGMLLLAAYLHDIGMSPEYDKVQRHWTFLTERKQDILSPAEIVELQQWIDNDTRTKDIDIREETIRDPKLVNYILSYYIRHKHNDWSGDWIRKNLGNEVLIGYPRWVSDLILICQSHHYGLDHLLLESFDAYPLSSGAVIHLRYLSMCLRAADVLENDPERTPEVILSHRQISADSLSFWLKDHQFSLVRKENTYTIHARPERAFIHKAIEETADLIDRELKLCDELNRRKPLSWSPLMDLSKYEWTVVPILNRDIRPSLDSYEYIQGSFRPNTARIMELLGGHQLYGDPIWAYRELIQNAFDAVKERIAYKLIHEKESGLNPGRAFSIDLSLVEKEDGTWLICKDHGVGMTKGIIEGYFLQSGFSKRHEIKELERECRKNGFYLGRTGQFGIGVLSYFMLAEKIVVKTKREFNTGYQPADSIAWKFEINGTHDFGELARYDAGITGTQLELKLKPEITANITEWDERFQKFLKDSLSKTPCTLGYTSYLGASVKMAPGWTNGLQDIKDRIQRQARQDILDATSNGRMNTPEMVSSHRREQQQRQQLFFNELLDELRCSLEFFSTEGQISDYIKYRIHIPYFKLSKGNSFFFLKEAIEGSTHYIDGVNFGQVWMPDMHTMNCAVKGVLVAIPADGQEKTKFPWVYVEIDFEAIDELKLEISRRNFQMDRAQYKEIADKIDDVIVSLIKDNEASLDNCYGLLNCQYAGFVPSELYWIFMEKEGQRRSVLKKIEFPVVQRHFIKKDIDELFYRGERAEMALRNLSHYNHYGYYHIGPDYISWEGKLKFAYQTGLLSEEIFVPYPVVMHAPTAVLKGRFHEIELPEEWDSVIFAMNNSGDHLMLNTRHPLAHLYDPDLVEMFRSLGFEDFFPETENEAACFNFLILALSHYSSDEWIAFCERDADEMEEVFARLGLEEALFLSDHELMIAGVGSYGSLLLDEETKGILPAARDEKYYFTRGGAG